MTMRVVASVAGLSVTTGTLRMGASPVGCVASTSAAATVSASGLRAEHAALERHSAQCRAYLNAPALRARPVPTDVLAP